jgi:1-acyl-sn-glycerol-3-phosphate acyltransferase
MNYYLSKLGLWLLGWKIDGYIPEGLKKAVIVVVPHTSNWDFILGRMVMNVLRSKAKFLIKEESFFFPLGMILKGLGAIPVARGRSGNMINQVAGYFNEAESLFVIITPEGTRKPTKRWKKGFYYIAQRANVPLILGVMDYKNKKGGVGEVFYPTGDMDKDLDYIYAFYRTHGSAKHPEKFVLPDTK